MAEGWSDIGYALDVNSGAKNMKMVLLISKSDAVVGNQVAGCTTSVLLPMDACGKIIENYDKTKLLWEVKGASLPKNK